MHECVDKSVARTVGTGSQTFLGELGVLAGVWQTPAMGFTEGQLAIPTMGVVCDTALGDAASTQA